MSSTMSSYYPTTVILIAKDFYIHNTKHGTLNAELFNPINFQTLQTFQTLLSSQRGTRNLERGTFYSSSRPGLNLFVRSTDC
jgi:hypothetical protein